MKHLKKHLTKARAIAATVLTIAAGIGGVSVDGLIDRLDHADRRLAHADKVTHQTIAGLRAQIHALEATLEEIAGQDRDEDG